MANDGRSGRKIKNDESVTSFRRLINRKGSSSLGSGATDTSGLRRSTRETSSRKQMTSSPSSMRKSERLEKRMPTTPPVEKKPERVEKKRRPSPLRRSERGKKHNTSSSSGSKKSEKGSSSSHMKRKKGKTQKIVKRLTVEAKDICISEKRDMKPFDRKRKRMVSRTFKALFQKQRRRDTATDDDDELEKTNKLSQVDSSSDGGSPEQVEDTEDGGSDSEQVEDREDGGHDSSMSMGEELREECVERASEGALRRSNSNLRNFDLGTSGNHEPWDGDDIKASKSGGIVKETLDDAGRVLVDCSKEEKLRTLELVDSASVGKSCDGDIDMGSGDTAIPSKRKRYAKDMDSDASATIASKDICASSADAFSSLSSGCRTQDVIEMCIACSKRQRVELDSQGANLCSCNITLNKGLYDTSIAKDRGELEAGGTTGLAEKCDDIWQQNKTPLDIQMDVNENMCLICNLGGKLMRCDGKGCKRSCHLSCLDPPLYDVPPVVWHCIWCVKKKIESGVHSVSKGVESIWDSREVKLSDGEGLQKEYFVKYKGLAHIHNQWVPETQLQLEAPLLVTKFNKKDQVVKWNEELAVPHRLLMKRLLKSPKQQNESSEHAGEILGCRYEWLVKWRGLGYEHATWELENASFLSSTQGQNLIRDYDDRRKRAKAAAFSIDKSKKDSLVKLPKLAAGSPPGIDNNHLNIVNKLCEYLHKGQNAVVFDEQERVMKIILYVISLSNVCRPFLIITTSNSLSHWEAEFLRFTPSIDVVVYTGNRDTRKSIRTLEFYDEGGRIMFQVLLSSLEAVVEDEQILASLRWEAVIVDECQSSRISTHFERIKKLAADVRVLLFSRPIKESIAEYLNLLSLLDFCGDLANSGVSKTESNDNLGKLKERLSQYVAYDCKSDFFRFVEFWVPVQISNVQLEQYCATLLSNSISLCSCPKNDPVGALRDIIISSRKCCNHPYLVDQSLQGLLTKGLPEIEYLDVGIKASGKLQLLDVILSELKNRKLRVLILFQSIGGSGRDSIGDILDDFLRQRFGPDSYERVDGGLIPSKRQAALNKFNKDSGRFVFLLENRACLPSIKLSSVDTIVIFDSDWNLANDLRALNKISIDSQLEQIKIFRLYSSCTVEEKVLILAKNNLTLDSNFQNVSRSTSDKLLMWGASHLFNKLDEFHSSSIANISSEQSILNNVVKEFLALLSQDGKVNGTSNSIISKVQLSEGGYSTSFPLPSELNIQLSDREPPRGFWTKLLERKNPRWKYSSGHSQRHRKRVQYFDNSPEKLEAETNGAVKKRKKMVAHCIDSATVKPGVEGEVAGVKGGASGNHASKSLFSSDNSVLADSQKSLHLLLKPEISRLCELLKLSEDVKVMVGRFLEYVIENHHVNREPEAILQAFLISLCWIAASLLKHKIDRKESLALAKHHLKFICKEEEADSVYSKLRLLKKEFLSRKQNIKESYFSKDFRSAAEYITREPPDSKVSQSVSFNLQNVKTDIEERSQNEEFADDRLHLQQELTPNNKTTEEGMQNIIKFVQRKCEKRMAKLLRKQQEEIQGFYRSWDEKKLQLEKEHRLESALVSSIHSHLPVRMGKLKILDDKFAKKMEEHKCQKDICLKDLQAKQLDARNDLRQKTAPWLAEAKSSVVDGRVHNQLPLHGSESEHRPHDGPENVGPVSRHLIEEQSPSGIVDKMNVSGVVPADTSEIVPNGAIEFSIPTGALNVVVSPNSKNDEVETTAQEKASVARIDQPNRVDSSSHDGSENIVSTSLPCSEKQTSVGIISSVRGEEVVPSELPETVLIEDVGGFVSVETGTTAVESNRENDRTDAVNPDTPNALGNQNDGANSSISGNSPSVEPSLVELPSVQSVVSLPSYRLLPQSPVLQNECSQSLASIEIQDEFVPVLGNQSSMQQVGNPRLQPVDAGTTDPAIHEAPLVESLEQMLPSPSINLPLGHNQPDQSNHEGHPPFLHQVVQDTAELPNQSFLQHGGNFSIINGSTNLSSHEHQVASRMATIPLYSDPLQNELERIRRETDQTIKVHEHTKMQMKFQCDKEIEESIAQIRRKYDLRLQDTDTAFVLKKNELDSNHNKVLMNKILAEAFRSKCMDLRNSGPLGMQQGPSGFMQHLRQLSSQPAPRSSPVTGSQPVLRPSPVIGSQPALRPSPVTGLQPATRPSLVTGSQPEPRPSPVTGSQAAPRPSPITGSSSGGQPVASQQITAPPLQIVHQSAALFSSVPTRPPNINPITPSAAGNPRGGGEIRAPAPHLQRFRPPSVSAANLMPLQCAIPGQQAPISLPATSPSLPQPPPRPSLPSPPPLPPLLTNSSGFCTRPPQPEGTGVLPNVNNSSLSAVELLMNMDKRANTRRTNILPPLPDFCSNFESLDLSEFGTVGGIRVSSSPSTVATDVVCLSDDD